MTRQRDKKISICAQFWIALQTIFSFISYTFTSYATFKHFTKDLGNYLSGSKNKYGFGSGTTAIEVAQKYKDYIQGRTVIVTGSNTGCGYAASLALAKAGCHVVMATKDIERAEECVHDIRAQIPDAELTIFKCDLSDLSSIDHFVSRLSKTESAHNKHSKIWNEFTMLLNNESIALYPSHSTKDGLEGHFGINFLGHYYLIRKLITKMSENAKNNLKENQYARIICLASMVDTFIDSVERPDWKEVAYYHKNENFSEYLAYGYSKLAVILGTHFLSDYIKNEGLRVRINCCHPGVILDSGTLDHLIDVEHPIFYGKILLTKFFTKTVQQGAATEIFVASCPDIEEMTGEYFEDCKEAKSTSKYSNDKALAKELEIFVNNYLKQHGWKY